MAGIAPELLLYGNKGQSAGNYSRREIENFKDNNGDRCPVEGGSVEFFVKRCLDSLTEIGLNVPISS